MRHRARAIMSRAGVALVAFFIIWSGCVQAQESPPIRVLIEQLAASNVYLRAGTADGLRAADTLAARRTLDGPVVGQIRVMSTTEDRSVAVIIGPAFPLTRGDSLFLFPRSPRQAVPARTEGGPGRGARVPARPAQMQRDRATPRVAGQLSFDFSSLHTVTRGLGNDPETVTRDFNTPTAGLHLRATELPGGLQFTTSARASYRSSSDAIIAPTTSVRVYQASLEKSFRSLPLGIQLGRFYNRYEAYSGYWDGLLLHYGTRFGIGAAAGFEPDRLNEGVSTALPKYSMFLDYHHLGRSTSYSVDASFHQARPDNGTPVHTYAGLSQRVRVRRFVLTQHLQVDRNPESGRWVVTRAQARASVPLGRRADVHAGYTVRQPYQFGRSTDIIPFRRDHVTAGVTVGVGRGTLNADVATAHQDGRPRYYNVTSSVAFPTTGVLGLDLMVAGSYWGEATYHGVLVSPTLGRSFGRMRTRVTYQYYRSESDQAMIVSHAADLSVSMPLASGVRSTVRARVSQGDNLTSTGVYMSLWMAF